MAASDTKDDAEGLLKLDVLTQHLKNIAGDLQLVIESLEGMSPNRIELPSSFAGNRLVGRECKPIATRPRAEGRK